MRPRFILPYLRQRFRGLIPPKQKDKENFKKDAFRHFNIIKLFTAKIIIIMMNCSLSYGSSMDRDPTPMAKTQGYWKSFLDTNNKADYYLYIESNNVYTASLRDDDYYISRISKFTITGEPFEEISISPTRSPYNNQYFSRNITFFSNFLITSCPDESSAMMGNERDHPRTYRSDKVVQVSVASYGHRYIIAEDESRFSAEHDSLLISDKHVIAQMLDSHTGIQRILDYEIPTSGLVTFQELPPSVQKIFEKIKHTENIGCQINR